MADSKAKLARAAKARRLFNASALTWKLWNFTGTAILNLLVWAIALAYLSPLTYMAITSVKTHAQLLDNGAPIYPARALSFAYQGRTVDVYEMPLPGGKVGHWALIEAGRAESEFIDVDKPGSGLIRWEGAWRSLKKAYVPEATVGNFANLWQHGGYPRLLRNSLIVTILGEIGILASSIAVAYGFSRFRIPGGKYIFLLCIATIMIPDSITLVPTFVIFTRVLNWNGSFLPLVIPQFFGSAIYIFLLRQNFRTIPREMDEAAMLEGAGPLRILTSIVLPQMTPAVATVAILQFFNSWNEMRMASLYLGTRSDLRTMAFSAQAFISYGFTPEMMQASAIVLMAIPILVLFMAQRYFMQHLVVTGMEK